MIKIELLVVATSSCLTMCIGCGLGSSSLDLNRLEEFNFLLAIHEFLVVCSVILRRLKRVLEAVVSAFGLWFGVGVGLCVLVLHLYYLEIFDKSVHSLCVTDVCAKLIFDL